MSRVLSIVPRPWSVGIVVMESPTILMYVELFAPRVVSAYLTTRAHDLAVQALNVLARFGGSVVLEATPLTFGAEVSIYEYATAFGVMFGEIAQKTQAPEVVKKEAWVQHLEPSYAGYAIRMASEYPSYAKLRHKYEDHAVCVADAIGMARWWLTKE